MVAAVKALLPPYLPPKMMVRFKRVQPLRSRSSQLPASLDLAPAGRRVQFGSRFLLFSKKQILSDSEQLWPYCVHINVEPKQGSGRVCLPPWIAGVGAGYVHIGVSAGGVQRSVICKCSSQKAGEAVERDAKREGCCGEFELLLPAKLLAPLLVRCLRGRSAGEGQLVSTLGAGKGLCVSTGRARAV